MHTEKIGRSLGFHLKNIAFSRFVNTSEYYNIISPFSRMYLITEGNGYVVLKGKKIPLETGFLILIPSFTPATYVFVQDLAHFYIHFSINIPNGLSIYNLYLISNKVKASGRDYSLFSRLLELNPDHELPHHDPHVYQNKPWINKDIIYPSLGHYLESMGIIQQLFSRFSGRELNNDIYKLPGHVIQNALLYIQKNINNDLSVEKLANIACLSRDHFSRLFKSITGMPPREFIIRKRIETAQLFLLTTDCSLNHIIENSGFKTTAYFCRIFKKYTSLTPEEFRRGRRPGQ